MTGLLKTKGKLLGQTEPSGSLHVHSSKVQTRRNAFCKSMLVDTFLCPFLCCRRTSHGTFLNPMDQLSIYQDLICMISLRCFTSMPEVKNQGIIVMKRQRKEERKKKRKKERKKEKWEKKKEWNSKEKDSNRLYTFVLVNYWRLWRPGLTLKSLQTTCGTLTYLDSMDNFLSVANMHHMCIVHISNRYCFLPSI